MDLGVYLAKEEEQIIKLLGTKATNKEIAKACSITRGELRKMIKGIHRKLLTKERAELEKLGMEMANVDNEG